MGQGTNNNEDFPSGEIDLGSAVDGFSLPRSVAGEEPAEPSNAVRDLTGLDLNGLLIKRKLGQGGMGEVWLGHHEDLDIPVAVKVLPPALAADQGFLIRFLREARAVAKLDHPNIVRVLDAGKREVSGHFIRLMVMEYVEGKDAHVALKSSPGRKMEPMLAARVALAAAKALKYAHGKGIIHRDVKPANILISKDGESIKLLDFGLAKLTGGRTPSPSSTAEDTGTGNILGTPAYMPPEQAEGKVADGRADIYSLGITLYELVSGSLPYTGGSVFSIIEGHVRRPLPFPEEAFAGVPELFRELIGGMCEKKPDDRTPLKHVIEQLDAFLGGSSSAPITSKASSGSLPVVRTNLVKRESSFVGRQQELWDLQLLLDECRLVTIVGPGGVGKTRITQEFGLSQSGSEIYPGGVWFCDLTEARTPEGICHAVALGLGIPLTQTDSAAQLEATLAMRPPLLLILDNFEQVVQFGQETLGRWISKAPHAKFLASSREPLHLEGEKSFPLSPLSSSWEGGRPRPPMPSEGGRPRPPIQPKGFYKRRRVPHLDEPGYAQFITFRLADSIPPSPHTQLEFESLDRELDQGRGECILRDAQCAQAVIETLKHFDGEQYDLLAWVVMPNHVHVLAALSKDSQLPTIVQAWKSVSARKINSILGRNGKVWQDDNFDGFMRDEEHQRNTMAYIIGNPVKAELCERPEEWPFSWVIGWGEEADEGVHSPVEVDLPLPPAVQLFVDRASDVKRGFVLDDASREAVEKIVDQLDGIPLAIELAASRCAALAPQKILERLPRRFDLLKGRRQDASARQATLRGAIDWSWDLLKPYEQSALAQCSVFSGGFFLEAGEAVIDLTEFEDAPFEMDVIESLVEKSLLVSYEVQALPGESRYRMLESIRQYAGEKLMEIFSGGRTPSSASATNKDVADGGVRPPKSDPTYALLLRHAEHYLEYAEEWDEAIHGPDAVEALSRMRLELENLFGIQDIFEQQDIAASAKADTESMAGREGPTLLAARAILCAASTLEISGPWRVRMPRLKRALTSLNDNDDVALRMKLAVALTKASADCGSAEELEAAAGICATLASELADAKTDKHKALCLNAAYAQSIAHLRGGRLQESISFIEEALDAQGCNAQSITAARGAGETSLRFSIALCSTLCGYAYVQAGEPSKSLNCLSVAEAICRELGDPLGIAKVLSVQGAAHGLREEFDRSLVCFSGAEAIFREVDDRFGISAMVNNRGTVQSMRGNREAALACYLEAENICRELGSQLGLANSLNNIAVSRHRSGKFDDALAAFSEAENVARQISAQYILSGIIVGKAQVLLDMGKDLRGALELSRESLELVSGMAIQHSDKSFNALAIMAVIEHRLAGELTSSSANATNNDEADGGVRPPIGDARKHALEAKALGEKLKIDRRYSAPHPWAGQVTEFWQYIDEVLGAE